MREGTSSWSLGKRIEAPLFFLGVEVGRYEGLSQDLKMLVKIRDRHRCRWCGRTNVPTDAHHIRYRRGKVDDVASNLISLCRFCHDFVHGAKTPAGDTIDKQLAQQILYALIEMPACTGLALRRQWERKAQNDLHAVREQAT